MSRLKSDAGRWPRWGVPAVVAVLVGAAVFASRRAGAPRPCPMSASAIGTFVRVPGGGFRKGAGGLYPEEGRAARVFVSPFLLQVHEVTNDQFQAFVDATGYLTDAEKGAGSTVFVETQSPSDLESWWRPDPSATWRTPQGAGSDLEGRGRHPVVHVSLRDARAYAEWVGARLPNEFEWEYAASLGLVDPDEPESGLRGPDGAPRANIWSGDFPARDTARDGYAGTAPVGCFEANRIGAHDMIGNVWEWTETRFGKGAPRFTIKGGSYLCSEDYCRRYRPAARQGFESGFSIAHVGFRVVKDVKEFEP